MKLLGTKEAAEKLGVSERRIRFLCQTKRLGTKVGGNWIITEEEVGIFHRRRRPQGRPKKSRR